MQSHTSYVGRKITTGVDILVLTGILKESTSPTVGELINDVVRILNAMTACWYGNADLFSAPNLRAVQRCHFIGW